MKRNLILILPLLFAGVFLHAEPFLDISIEGSDAIKQYIEQAKKTEKQQLLKLIQAGDKFAQLDLDGDICGCEPEVECPKILNLTDYSSLDYEVENSMFNQYCNVEFTRKRADGSDFSMDWYLIDKDTHLVALSIEKNTHKAILTYASSLVGIMTEGNIGGDSEDAVLWDTANRGKAVRISYIFNTLNNKAISRSPTNIIIMYYGDQVYAAQALIGRGVFSRWSKEHTKRQKKLADEITADLLNYQKTHHSKNFKK